MIVNFYDFVEFILRERWITDFTNNFKNINRDFQVKIAVGTHLFTLLPLQIPQITLSFVVLFFNFYFVSDLVIRKPFSMDEI